MSDQTKKKLDDIILRISAAALTALVGIATYQLKTTVDVSTRVAVIGEELETGKNRDTQFEKDLTELRARVTQCEIDLAKLKN